MRMRSRFMDQQQLEKNLKQAPINLMNHEKKYYKALPVHQDLQLKKK